MRSNLMFVGGLGALLLCGASFASAQAPLGTGFTYQGQLLTGGVPVDEPADVQLRLYDAAVGGVALTGTVTRLAVPIEDGLFTLQDVNFGVNVFNGEDVFLQIAVRVPAGGGAYTTLAPRQRIAPTPYALQTRGMFVNTALDVVFGLLDTDGLTVTVNDGEGDPGVVLETSATGTANDIQLYRDGVLAKQHESVSEGLQTTWLNTDSNLNVLAGGVSFADDSGFWEVYGKNGTRTVWLDADNDQNGANDILAGALQIRSTGTNGPGGELNIQNNDGVQTISAFGGVSGAGSTFFLGNGHTDPNFRFNTVELYGDSADGGLLYLRNSANGLTVQIDGDSGDGAYVSLRNRNASTRIALDGDSAEGGVATVYAADGSSTIFLDGEAASSGGLVSCRNDISEETVQILGDDNTDAGRINVFNREGSLNVNTLQLEAQEDAFGTGSRILGRNENGNTTWWLDSHDGAGGAWFTLYEDDGSEALFYSVISKQLQLKNAAGTTTITFNGQTGGKSGVVATENFGQRLLYAVESTEVWFEDFGSGQLVNGQARIDLDPVFAETVTITAQHPMQVFVTLTGDCNGVYIQKFNDHFIVRELAAGRSNATFDFRVVAKRKGLENTRLEEFADDVDAAEGMTPVYVPSTPAIPTDLLEGETDGQGAELEEIEAPVQPRSTPSDATDVAIGG